MSTKTQIHWHVRWMIKNDLGEVLDAEKMGGNLDWDGPELLSVLAGRNCIGMVILDENSRDCRVIGFMVYELRTKSVRLLNFAVHPEWQSKGAGCKLIEKLKSKLSSHRREHLIVDVPEECLNTQLFLKRRGFRATKIIKDVELKYRMVFSIPH